MNPAQNAHASLDGEKGHIQNSVQNGLQQAYEMIGELQSAIASAEYDIKALRELDAKEEK